MENLGHLSCSHNDLQDNILLQGPLSKPKKAEKTMSSRDGYTFMHAEQTRAKNHFSGSNSTWSMHLANTSACALSLCTGTLIGMKDWSRIPFRFFKSNLILRTDKR